ncbi:PDZ domain-containing protein [Radicibacter daui]|uniref:PDZ domain-containing protein n=1 Tax=Radicibacter daui TaxID=3064829 RepID=UPI0040468E02
MKKSGALKTILKTTFLSAIGTLVLGLGGCALDPAGLAISAAGSLYSPPDPATVIVPEFKNSFGAYNCPSLAEAEVTLKADSNDPGDVVLLGALEAIRQLKAEKGCSAITQTAPTQTSANSTANNVSQTPPDLQGGFGLEIETLSSSIGTAIGLNPAQGAVVISALKGGTGEKAGLEPLDVIVEVAGQKVANAADLQGIVSKMRPGFNAPVRIWRDHTFADLTVEVATPQAPVAATAAAPAAANSASTESRRGWLGVVVFSESLSIPLVRDLNLPDAHGVLVVGTGMESAAAQAGLKAFDIIQSIDGQAFDRPDQLLSYLSSRKAGNTVNIQILRNHSTIPLTATLKAEEPANPPVPAGVEIYCYATASPYVPEQGGSVYWISTLFPVPGATLKTAVEHGNVVGPQFRQYLISQGISPGKVEAAFGICSTYGSANDSLQASVARNKTAAFTSTGSTIVTLRWAP